jgi:hypothetical protein
MEAEPFAEAQWLACHHARYVERMKVSGEVETLVTGGQRESRCVQKVSTYANRINELEDSLDQRTAEATAAAEAHARALVALSDRDTHAAAIADSLARTDEQTNVLEALCIRTERVSGEHMSVLQCELAGLRVRCEELGLSLREEREALAVVAAQAEALARGERVAQAAEAEATEENAALASELLRVQVCAKHSVYHRGIPKGRPSNA